jgi:uncharacterized protein
MVFDYHAHLYHPDWYPRRFNDYLVTDFLRRRSSATPTAAQLATATQAVTRMLADRSGEATLRVMDHVGIDRRVLLIVDWGVELGEAAMDLAAVHREVLGLCRRSNGRLVGFAGVDPRRADALTIMREAFDDLGARGLKLHPTGAYSLLDERTHAVVALAVERRLPVLVHVGPTMSILSDRNAQPNEFLKLASSFPSGRFIAGHSGFELFEEFVRAPERCANVMFDISGWQQFLATSAQTFHEHLGRLNQAFAGRVCFGSDAPFFSYNLASSETKWLNEVRNATAALPGTDAAAILEGPPELRAMIGNP